jgi:uncharacterized protein with NRDE domain
MCLIAFAIGLDPRSPLLLAANRDEFFDRPTEGLHRWSLPGGTGVLAGRDLRDGGTWLGVSETGRVAMLTNVRSAQPGSGPRSRGELPTRWLAGKLDLEGLRASVNPGEFGAFNLVVGDLRRGTWCWLSNCHPEHPHTDQGRSLHMRLLVPGLYGLSNASLDTPWPKTLLLKSALQASLAQLDGLEKDVDVDWMLPMTHALADRTPSQADALPDTGVPPEWERLLSSPFVSGVERGYGTRSSAVMRALPESRRPDGAWRVEVHEWSHTPQEPGRTHRWNPDSYRSELLRC